MFAFPDSPYLVPHEGPFSVASAASSPPAGAPDKGEAREQLAAVQKEMRTLQRMLYAQDKFSLLLVFQAMDAAGKDGTIRAVMSGVNPAGCHVTSFKAPTYNELDHDFLWRTAVALPERGRIGIFNRSYYEEVLVVRVHPEYLGGQRLPELPPLDDLWPQRFDSIRDHEKHLARNGTVILKFWLNVSRDEQRKRFLDRIDDPAKNWKFNSGDVRERGYWDDYMAAYEDALGATSRPWAPWYAVPADDKSYMRLTVARIIVQTMKSMGLAYPVLDSDEAAKLGRMREALIGD